MLSNPRHLRKRIGEFTRRACISPLLLGTAAGLKTQGRYAAGFEPLAVDGNHNQISKNPNMSFLNFPPGPKKLPLIFTPDTGSIRRQYRRRLKTTMCLITNNVTKTLGYWTIYPRHINTSRQPFGQPMPYFESGLLYIYN